MNDQQCDAGKEQAELYERIGVFTAPRPNQTWVGDITYISTDEGWLYLAVVLDLCSRKVVGSTG